MLLFSQCWNLASFIILSQQFVFLLGLQQQQPPGAQPPVQAPPVQFRLMGVGTETNPCRDDPPSANDHIACQRYCDQHYGRDPNYHNNPWTIGKCKRRGDCRCLFNYEAFGHWLDCWASMLISDPRKLQQRVLKRYRRQGRSSSVVRNL